METDYKTLASKLCQVIGVSVGMDPVKMKALFTAATLTGMLTDDDLVLIRDLMLDDIEAANPEQAAKLRADFTEPGELA